MLTVEYTTECINMSGMVVAVAGDNISGGYVCVYKLYGLTICTREVDPYGIGIIWVRVQQQVIL